jgi:acyl-CoA thioesterase-2
MANLADDTVVEGRDGRYVAKLSADWQVWGPMGGYLAAIALRAAGAQAKLSRPAAFSCHFLSVAEFTSVDLEVVTLRASRRAESFRITMTQAARPVMEALVWVVAPSNGLTHDAGRCPEVPPPEQLRSIDELLTREQRERGFAAKFFKNFEQYPTKWNGSWMERKPTEPTWTTWMRFREGARCSDPYLQAAQQLVLLDLGIWFAPAMAYRPEATMLIGPSLDLRATFHRFDPDVDWFLTDGYSPMAEDGLIGSECRVWDRRGRLLASGEQQLMCRPAPVTPAPATPS